MCYLCMGKDEKDMMRVHGNWPGKWVAGPSVASAASGNPPDPNPPAATPAPAKGGIVVSGMSPFGAPQPTTYGPGQGPKPITKVNSTTDPRIIWEDGQVAVIYAKDFPAGSGMGRSKTRAGVVECLSIPIDDALHTAPGPGSRFEFVKVWLKDILARPVANPAITKQVGRVISDPSQLVPHPPKVATGGRYKGQVIPDFPHTCAACGGPCYQGMFQNIHDTPSGRCPTEDETKKKRR
jgi:hypothetical protein